MKITKARLKEIIQEELSRDEEPNYSTSGAEDLKSSIARDQSGPNRVQEIKDDLLVLYRKMSIHGPTREIVDMIEELELELQDLEV